MKDIFTYLQIPIENNKEYEFLLSQHLYIDAIDEDEFNRKFVSVSNITNSLRIVILWKQLISLLWEKRYDDSENERDCEWLFQIGYRMKSNSYHYHYSFLLYQLCYRVMNELMNTQFSSNYSLYHPFQCDKSTTWEDIRYDKLQPCIYLLYSFMHEDEPWLMIKTYLPYRYDELSYYYHTFRILILWCSASYQARQICWYNKGVKLTKSQLSLSCQNSEIAAKEYNVCRYLCKGGNNQVSKQIELSCTIMIGLIRADCARSSLFAKDAHILYVDLRHNYQWTFDVNANLNQKSIRDHNENEKDEIILQSPTSQKILKECIPIVPLIPDPKSLGLFLTCAKCVKRPYPIYSVYPAATLVIRDCDGRQSSTTTQSKS